jgi:hypothetical protein
MGAENRMESDNIPVRTQRNILLIVVLLGVVFYWGQPLIKYMGEASHRDMEEKMGVPVWASWHEATGPGKVLVLDYLNKKHPLTVTVLITRPSNGERKSIDIDLNPDHHKTVEIGWLEGWSFSLGDNVQLSSGNYKPLTFVLK